MLKCRMFSFSRNVAFVATASFLMVCQNALAASSASRVTLEEVLAYSAANSPVVQAIQSKLGLGDAEILAAITSRPNPKLLSDNGVAEYTYRLGIEQTLELGGKRHQRIKLAKANKAVLAQDIQQELLLLRRKVRDAFVACAVSSLAVSSLDTLVKALPAEMSDDQMIPAYSGYQAQLQYKAANLETAQRLAQNTLRAISYREWDFNAAQFVLPEEPSIPQRVLETISALPADGDCLGNTACLKDIALKQRPDLAALFASLQVAKQEEIVSKRSRIPNLSIITGPDLSLTFPRQLNVFLVAQMEVPVFNRQQGAIQAAQVRQHIVKLEQVAQANDIALDVDNAQLQYKQALHNRQQYKTVFLPMAAQAYDKAKQVYNASDKRVDQLQALMAAHEDYVTVMDAYVQTELAVQDSISGLEAALGISF